MKKQVNVGFIGAGSFVSGYHLLTARDSELMKIRAIADISKETLELQQKKFKPDYVTTDYKEVLADPEIDMVIIGTKHDLHAKLIIESLEANKWVFCEKPMAQDDQESRAVIEAVEKSTGKLAIGFNRRFAPAHRDMKKLIQSVKRPWFLYYRQMCPYVSKAKFYYTQPHILYEGTHILDLVCWLFDDVPVRVNMTGDFTDNSVQLEFKDGSQVLFLCGTMSSFLYWKEQLEFCAEHHAINIADMVDMRVRGWEGEFDRLYSPYLDEKKEEVFKYGFDFYDTLRSELIYRQTDFITGYRTTSMMTVPLVASNDSLLGVLQIINAQDNDGNVIPFDQDAELYIKHFASSVAQAMERADLLQSMVMRLVALAEFRDPKETGAHVNRVSAYSVEIYDRWAFNHNIDDLERNKFRDTLSLAAKLHDVGKVAVPDTILKLERRFEHHERMIINKHTYVVPLLFPSLKSDLDIMSRDIALRHQEKWDGTGYPGHYNPDDVKDSETVLDLTDIPGLKGEEIPLAARIVSVADVFDALCSKRCYKLEWTIEDSRKEILRCAGTQFDPEVVKAFDQCFDAIVKIQSAIKDKD